MTVKLGIKKNYRRDRMKNIFFKVEKRGCQNRMMYVRANDHVRGDVMLNAW